MVRGMSSPTATLERLTEANRTGERVLRGPKCETRDLLAALPDDARAAVVMALTMPNEVVSTADITKSLTARGLPVKTENLGRHRRRLQGKAYGCKCPLPDGDPA